MAKMEQVNILQLLRQELQQCRSRCVKRENCWYFSKQDLEKTPSRQEGISGGEELRRRQEASCYMQDLGERVGVSQTTINRAVLLMHHFFMYSSLGRHDRFQIFTAALFLSAKLDNDPRPPAKMIEVEHALLCEQNTCFHNNDPKHLANQAALERKESQILEVVDWDIDVQLIHNNILKLCSLVHAGEPFTKGAYFLATNSLLLTTMCLQHSPSIMACVCINVSCKWSSTTFPKSNTGKAWYHYAEDAVTPELLEDLSEELMSTLKNCPLQFRQRLSRRRPSSINRAIPLEPSADKKNILPAENSSRHQENKVISPVKIGSGTKTEPQGKKLDIALCDASKDLLPYPESTGSFSNILPAPSGRGDGEQSNQIVKPEDKGNTASEECPKGLKLILKRDKHGIYRSFVKSEGVQQKRLHNFEDVSEHSESSKPSKFAKLAQTGFHQK